MLFCCFSDRVQYSVLQGINGVYCLFPTARCFLEKDSGGACGSYMSRWYYSQQTKKCMHFWYGGCGGNENRFLTEDECFRECVSADVCQLKLDAGTCSNFSMKWFFEVRSGECVQFWYGGCDGNSNRFNTQEDCEIRCLRAKKYLQTSKLVQYSVLQGINGVYCLFPTARCFLEKDSGGACGSYMSRWYYSQQTKKCMHFWYGGCGGNENRFLTEDECFRECVVLRLFKLPPQNLKILQRMIPVSRVKTHLLFLP
uniref:BPTI/Kunitz inhibitor domain-containing protein n=1 Tax=Sinocyclocheilus anshuiensis TaxID=1608454 RepID=A0A671KU37_9TELE